MWCLRRLLRVPWTAKRSNQFILEEISPETDAEAETPILWPPDAKNWLIGKAPDAGKDWRREEKGATEDEMVGWNHRLNGHEFEQFPGEGAKPLICGSQQTGKFFMRWEYQTTWPSSWEICMQVKKQQLELDMEEQTGSKLGKEYVTASYFHHAYLSYMQSTSCKILGWKKHKLE